MLRATVTAVPGAGPLPVRKRWLVPMQQACARLPARAPGSHLAPSRRSAHARYRCAGSRHPGNGNTVSMSAGNETRSPFCRQVLNSTRGCFTETAICSRNTDKDRLHCLLDVLLSSREAFFSRHVATNEPCTLRHTSSHEEYFERWERIEHRSQHRTSLRFAGDK